MHILIFGRPFLKPFALCYRTVVCLSCLSLSSVCDIGILWPNSWMDQDETWHGGRPRPRTHCVRWGPSSLQRGTAPNFRPMSVAKRLGASVSETASRRHLRSAANHQLTVPPHRRTTYGGRAFAVACPSTWNSLPKRLRDLCCSSAVSGRLLKTFLFSEYWCI